MIILDTSCSRKESRVFVLFPLRAREKRNGLVLLAVYAACSGCGKVSDDAGLISI